MRINPAITQIPLESNELRLVANDAFEIYNGNYLVEGNFVVYNELFYNMHGLCRKIDFVFYKKVSDNLDKDVEVVDLCSTMF